MMQFLGPNIKLIRKAAGDTQETFAARFKATKAMIVSYEIKKSRPDDYLLNKIAKFAGVSVKALETRLLDESELKLDLGEMVFPAAKGQGNASSDPIKDELIKSLRSQIELLNDVIKTSLDKIANGQISIQANLFAHTLRSAERFAKGKEQATEEEMDKIDMYASRYLDRHLSSDKAARKIGKV